MPHYTHVGECDSDMPTLVPLPMRQEDCPAGKPQGLWYEVDAGWRKWASENMPYRVSGRPLYRVVFGGENILRLPTVEALVSFTQDYGQLRHYGGSLIPNWSRVAQEYDGVEIAPWHDPYLMDITPNPACWCSGWDVPSGCIWRPKGVVLEYIGDTCRRYDPRTDW